TRSKTLVAKNGNYAITAMSEIIKRSRSVNGVFPDLPPDDPRFRSGFTDCTAAGGIEGDHLALKMTDSNEVILSCNYDDSGKVASKSGATVYNLTDQSLITDTCKITCHQSSSFSAPRIEIEFSLGIADGGGGIAENTKAVFQTQINIRNYNTK
ncbi:MAG TPA: hypothetical protein PLD54_03615, partial [Candidatus Levybacteria bacterium]|nr:hypothetical protein [Candidatus Levybacteria bacterium]